MQVEVLQPVFCHRAIDLTGQRIPDASRVAVVPQRPVDRLPDCPLATGAAIRSDSKFVEVLHANRRTHVAVGSPRVGPLHLQPVVLGEVRVGVLVHVDDLVVVEIHWIRTPSPGTAVDVGIEDLHGERLPASCRATRQDARPSFGDHPKFFLEVGDQFVVDCVPVGADVH